MGRPVSFPYSQALSEAQVQASLNVELTNDKSREGRRVYMFKIRLQRNIPDDQEDFLARVHAKPGADDSKVDLHTHKTDCVHYKVESFRSQNTNVNRPVSTYR